MPFHRGLVSQSCWICSGDFGVPTVDIRSPLFCKSLRHRGHRLLLMPRQLHLCAKSSMHQGITAGPPVSIANFREHRALTCEGCEDGYSLYRFSSYLSATRFWLVSTLVLLNLSGSQGEDRSDGFRLVADRICERSNS